MPFGVRTTSKSFQVVADELLQPRSNLACAYIDDTAVFLEHWVGHLTHLELVMASFASVNMTLRLAKCKFGLHRMMYIGHEVGSGTSRVIQGKVKVIGAIPEPHTKKHLMSFLGM